MEFKYILSQFVIKRFKKHQYLIQEGDASVYAYFVNSGLLKLVYSEESGKQHIVSFAWEDWWESDFTAFYTQHKATMSLECLEDTEVYCFTYEGYQNICNTIQKMERFFLVKANFGFLSAQRRILSLMTSSAQERYDQLLEQYPSLFQRLPKSVIASFLGVSRETLSRFSS